MNVSKRLVSGILGAILALGGVSAKRDRKRVSRSDSLSAGKKIAIGGVVLSLPTALLFWELSKGGSKSEEGSLLGKKGELAMAESEANPEVPSKEEILEPFSNKLYSKDAGASGLKEKKKYEDRVLKHLETEGLRGDSKLCEEVRRMIDGFVVNVVSKKVEDKLVVGFNFGIDDKCFIKIENYVGLTFVDDGKKSEFKGIVELMLKDACKLWLCRELGRNMDKSSEQVLINLMVPYFYITSGKQMVADLEKRFDELGWY